mmetsp:Transcript_28610/g.69505  ORF Transcript_28610/g.69505 Transcript_28610/m.69505 type:complete len:80 (-) Transcript_28610:186-425(-)
MYLTRADGHKKVIVRSRHETVNSRFNDYAILSTMYRHDYLFHGICFRAVAVIIQLGLHERPIWEIEYNINYNDQSELFL